MPLIPFADTNALPEKAKEAYDRLPRKLNIFRMWANAPEMFVSGMRFGGNILARQKLNAALRELVILLVARLEGGTYEWVQHVPIAEGVGCRKDQDSQRSSMAASTTRLSTRSEKVLLQFSPRSHPRREGERGRGQSHAETFLVTGDCRSDHDLRLLHDDGAADRNRARRYRRAGRHGGVERAGTDGVSYSSLARSAGEGDREAVEGAAAAMWQSRGQSDQESDAQGFAANFGNSGCCQRKQTRRSNARYGRAVEWFIDHAAFWLWEENGVVQGFSAGDPRDGTIFALFVDPASEKSRHWTNPSAACLQNAKRRGPSCRPLGHRSGNSG